jgi:hypothetical protein
MDFVWDGDLKLDGGVGAPEGGSGSAVAWLAVGTACRLARFCGGGMAGVRGGSAVAAGLVASAAAWLLAVLAELVASEAAWLVGFGTCGWCGSVWGGHDRPSGSLLLHQCC